MEDTNNIQTQSTGTEAAAEAVVDPTDSNPIDPEAERLRAENDDLKNAIRVREARDRIGDLLRAADAHSPELLFASVKEDLQFSDGGELQNAAALVDRLKRRFPEQFGPRPAAPASIDGGAGHLAPTRFISAETLGRMTPAQIQKLDWAEVRRVLSER